MSRLTSVATGAAPTRLRASRRRRPRDDAYRARRRDTYQRRIDEAETPLKLIAASIDYLRSNLTYVQDPERAWRVAQQVASVIVRVAGELEPDVTRGGNRDRTDHSA